MRLSFSLLVDVQRRVIHPPLLPTFDVKCTTQDITRRGLSDRAQGICRRVQIRSHSPINLVIRRFVDAPPYQTDATMPLPVRRTNHRPGEAATRNNFQKECQPSHEMIETNAV